MEEALIPMTEQGITIWSIFLYSGWAGVTALAVLFFYSIPMGIRGIKNPKKRTLFILQADDVCKILIAIFFMFTALAVIDQFYPSFGLDDRCFQIQKKITTVASSAFFVSLSIATTQLIKILLIKKEDSNQSTHSITASGGSE